MKFISVRDLRGKSAEIWKELPTEREMIITNNGRPIALLSSINESTIEESVSAARRARAIEAAIRMQKHSAAQGLDKLSMDEIDEEIRAARESRRL